MESCPYCQHLLLDCLITFHIFSSTSSLLLNCDTFPFTVMRHITGIIPFFFGALDSYETR